MLTYLSFKYQIKINIKLTVINLTFICPCIASMSLKYDQRSAKFSRSIYFYKLLCMFQAVPPPIIRSTKQFHLIHDSSRQQY